MSMKKTAIRGIFVKITIVVIVAAFFGWFVRPIITTPFTVQPITRYGIDVENPGLFARYNYGHRTQNRVYILGVFKGGSVFSGEEVTHKIDADALIEVLAEAVTIRSLPSLMAHLSQPPQHLWSINLHQNHDIHIILRGGTGEMLIMGREVRSYGILTGAYAIEAALERMIAEN